MLLVIPLVLSITTEPSASVALGELKINKKIYVCLVGEFSNAYVLPIKIYFI